MKVLKKFKNKNFLINFNGFTLAELLVVLTLFSLVIGTIYSFYNLSFKIHQNISNNTKFISQIRFFQKLISNKLINNNSKPFNVFMRKDGFKILKSNLTNIIKSNIHKNSEVLYKTLGYYMYSSHKELFVENTVANELSKKFKWLPISFENDTLGIYIYELSNLDNIKNNDSFKITLDCKPNNFLIKTDIVADKISFLANFLNDTIEIIPQKINDFSKYFKDISYLNYVFEINILNAKIINSDALYLFMTFDNKKAPILTFSSNIFEKNFKKYFVESSAIFCNDGIIFYESNEKSIINHAIYLDENQQENIKYLKYIVGFKNEKNEWESYEEIILNNVISFKIEFFNKNNQLINLQSNDWIRLNFKQISGFLVELVVFDGKDEIPIKNTYFIN